MDWSAEAIDRLRAFWGEGLSTAEIGRRMGVSKNAVVGKAHRLSLPARPSPIRRDPAAAARAVPVAAARAPVMRGAAVVAPRPAVPAAMAQAGGGFGAAAAASRGAMIALGGLAVASSPAPAAAPPPAAVVRSFPLSATPRAGGGARRCCWPIGEPGTPDFHFCSGEASPGKPYCVEHSAIAYVRTRDRREDAA